MVPKGKGNINLDKNKKDYVAIRIGADDLVCVSAADPDEPCDLLWDFPLAATFNMDAKVFEEKLTTSLASRSATSAGSGVFTRLQL